MSKALKLIAQDEDDLQVVSSLLQDMTIRVGDIALLAKEQKLAFVGNRFRWEKRSWFRRPKGERIRTAAHFSTVTSAKTHEINLKDKEIVLELLDIEAYALGDDMQIILNFAGGGAIRLTVDSIDLVVTDVSDSWDAINRPRHDLSDAAF
jgi:hypothetical protein